MMVGDDLTSRAPRDAVGSLLDVIAIYGDLSRHAVESLDLTFVANEIATQLETLACVVNSHRTLIAASCPGLSTNDAIALARRRLPRSRRDSLLRSAKRDMSATRTSAVGGAGRVIAAPIVVDGLTLAHLIVFETDSSTRSQEVWSLLVEHAATVCAIILGRDRALAASSVQVRNDLVEGLLLGRGSDEELRRWAGHLGYEHGEPHRVLQISTSGAGSPSVSGVRMTQERLIRTLPQFFTSRCPTAIVSVRGDDVVVVTPAGLSDAGSDPLSVAQECLTYASELASAADLLVGVSSPFDSAPRIPEAYRDAIRTVEVARRLGKRHEVIAFDDLGIHKLLVQVPDHTELIAFADQVLGSVRDYRRGNGPELIETLRVYFQENANRKSVAGRLFVHPNTVDYRLKRLSQIAGLDLDRYSDRLMAQIALEIYAIVDPA